MAAQLGDTWALDKCTPKLTRLTAMLTHSRSHHSPLQVSPSLGGPEELAQEDHPSCSLGLLQGTCMHSSYALLMRSALPIRSEQCSGAVQSRMRTSAHVSAKHSQARRPQPHMTSKHSQPVRQQTRAHSLGSLLTTDPTGLALPGARPCMHTELEQEC